MTLEPPGRELSRTLVRLADLALHDDVLRGYRFIDCQIVGPAIVVPAGATVISGCRWGGDPESLFWTFPGGREQITGAIVLVDCELIGCSLVRVGLAVPESALEAARAGFGL